MKFPKPLLPVLLLLAVAGGTAHAADLSQPVALVATEALAGSEFEQTVVVVVPVPEGGHVGFIVNRPTSVKLETMLPDDAASHSVVEPVYLGGPVLTEAVFAVTRKAPEGDGRIIPLLPGVVAVFDAASLDRVLEVTPNDARYFVGLMLWTPGQLEEQVSAGVWQLRSIDVDTVLSEQPAKLWQKLAGSSALMSPGISTRGTVAMGTVRPSA
jgi:putative transcriptional regulator